MLGDGSRRGASLEGMLSKLLHLGLSQIIGMSATLSNIQDISKYLDAESYTSQFRPVSTTQGSHFLFLYTYICISTWSLLYTYCMY